MAYIPQSYRFRGYETVDIQDSRLRKTSDIYLDRKADKAFECYRCSTPLAAKKGQYRVKLRHMPAMEFAVFVHLWRWQGYCSTCKKVRSEKIDFVSYETPHLTKDFAWWLGRMCEVAPVTNAADLCEIGHMTAWRVDLKRMQIMLKYYKIPTIEGITVDEVYARRKGRPGESRNKKFFTVITDLKTKRVIWVSESRDKEALDEFFHIIGPERCARIKVVAMDQHESYRASVREHCSEAKVVWDRFHLMQSFNEALNTIRKEIFDYSTPSDPVRRYTQGKYRFLFLKKDSKRTAHERQHLKDACANNQRLLQAEIIKERLYTFFDEHDEEKAWGIWDEIGDWIAELGFKYLIDWFNNLDKQWDTLRNYFSFRVTTSLSEGINNVIKTLKRKAYGYTNMVYFRLKIMQVAGYLNSKFISDFDQLMAEL